MYLLVGLTGSGKTTLAKRLEADGAIRLSVDELVFSRWGRYGIDYPEDTYFEKERPVVEEVERQLVELVEAGRDVVFDYGLWTRADRARMKRMVVAAGGRWRLLYLKVPKAELLRRLAERNRRQDPNALTVTASALEDFYQRFEEPVGEGEETVTP